jgi:hypothetical protein
MLQVYDASSFDSVGGLTMANAAAVKHLVFHPWKYTSGQYLNLVVTSATHRVLVARLEKGTRGKPWDPRRLLHTSYTIPLSRPSPSSTT